MPILGILNGYNPHTGAISPGSTKPPMVVFDQFGNSSPGVITDPDYTDFSSISNWWKFGPKIGLDYRFIRDRISEYVSTVQVITDPEWTALTDEEQFIVASNKCSTQSITTTYLGDSASYWMNLFDMKSQECRAMRYSNAKSVLINNVDLPTQYQILSTIQANTLDSQYLIYGVEGTMDGDPIEALFNFIEATPLSAYGSQTTNRFGNPFGKYSANGVAAMSMGFSTYSPLYGDTSPSGQSQVVTMMMNVLRLGIYS